MKKFFVNFKNFLLSLVLKLRLFFAKTSKSNVILCFDCLYDENQECIDAFSLFEYLKKNNIPSKYVALQNTCSIDKLQNLEDVIFVKNRWDFVFKYANLLKSSKAILTSFGLLCGIDKIIKNANKNYVFIEHGVIFHKEFVSELYSPENFNKILVPTKFTYNLYINNSLWDDKDMILSGLPRWDKFLPEEKSNNIFIFFTWRKAFLKNKKLANLYFENVISFLNELSQKLSPEIKITFAWHHEIYKNKLNIPTLPERVYLIKPQEFSFNVCKSSLLITDYSSIFWDYFYQEKPVVFYNPIRSCFENSVDKSIENAFLDFSFKIYNIFIDNNEAIKKILSYTKNNFFVEEEYKNMQDEFFWNNSKNCNKIVDYLLHA